MWSAILDLFKFFISGIGRGRRIESILKDTRVRVLRLEILDAMNRKDMRLVCALFDDYKKLGGNHYLDALYTDFMKKRRKK
jgi:hypothetical protein